MHVQEQLFGLLTTFMRSSTSAVRESQDDGFTLTRNVCLQKEEELHKRGHPSHNLNN